MRFPHSGNTPIQVKNQDYTAEHGASPAAQFVQFSDVAGNDGAALLCPGGAAAADSANGGSVQTPAVVPAAYKIGVGDVLHILVWAEPQLTETAVVRPDGKVSLPLVSELDVAGLTPQAVQQTSWLRSTSGK